MKLAGLIFLSTTKHESSSSKGGLIFYKELKASMGLVLYFHHMQNITSSYRAGLNFHSVSEGLLITVIYWALKLQLWIVW